MSITQFIQQAFVFLAVLTSMGTLLHDTKLNKAFMLSVPNEISVNVASHLDSLKEGASHTHVESVAQAFASNPRIQARDDHRRYNLAKYLARSNDQFGGSRILWPSV